MGKKTSSTTRTKCYNRWQWSAANASRHVWKLQQTGMTPSCHIVLIWTLESGSKARSRRISILSILFAWTLTALNILGTHALVQNFSKFHFPSTPVPHSNELWNLHVLWISVHFSFSICHLLISLHGLSFFLCKTEDHNIAQESAFKAVFYKDFLLNGAK